jgi:hypothetical protein
MGRSIKVSGRLRPVLVAGSPVSVSYAAISIRYREFHRIVNPFSTACPYLNLIRGTSYWHFAWKQRFALKNGIT